MNKDKLYTRQNAFNDFINKMNILYNPDKILREKGCDISIFENVENDGHVDSCLDSRKAGLFTNEWVISTASAKKADRIARDFISDLFTNHENLSMASIMSYLQSSVYWGYGVQEYTQQKDGNYIIIDSIEGLPRNYFSFDKDNQLRFLSKVKPLEGELVDMSKVILSQYNHNYANPYGKGKYSKIFYPVGIKRAMFRYGAEFAEKMGGAFLLGTTDDPNREDEMLEMLDRIIQCGSGVIKTDEQIRVLEAQKYSSTNIFKEMIEMCDQEVSKCILGQTLTTSTDGAGSYAMGKIHYEVRSEIIEQDKKYIIDYLSKLIKKIVDWNMSITESYPQFKFFEEADIQKDRAERDDFHYKQGVRFTKTYYIDTYGYKEEHFDLVTPNQAPIPNNKEVFQEANNNFIKFNEEDDLKLIYQEDAQIESYIDKTKPLFNEVFKDLSNDILKTVKEAGDYKKLSEKILNIRKIPLNNNVKALGKALLTADIIGRAYVRLNNEDIKQFADDNSSITDLDNVIFDYANVDFLKLKIPMTKDKFDSLDKQYANYAFTVTGYTEEEKIQEILQSIIDAKEKKLDFKEWKKNILEKGLNVSDLVYWQTIRSCEAAGRYQEMMEFTDTAPYWQYIAIRDSRTRPEHLALNGIVRRFDDSFWNSWYPPNGFRCRCYVRCLSAGYLDKKGIICGDGMPTLKEMNDNNKGNKFFDESKATLLKYENNGRIDLMPEKGFGNNIGKDFSSLYDGANADLEVKKAEIIKKIDGME